MKLFFLETINMLFYLSFFIAIILQILALIKGKNNLPKT